MKKFDYLRQYCFIRVGLDPMQYSDNINDVFKLENLPAESLYSHPEFDKMQIQVLDIGKYQSQQIRGNQQLEARQFLG